MDLVIHKRHIKDWLDSLKSRFKVIDTRKHILPPKQYLLPPKEDLFVYDKRNHKIAIPEIERGMILYGLGEEDLAAVNQLDEIMSKPAPDYYYLRRRKRAVVVGLVDNLIESAPGGDLILEKINKDQYRAWQISSKGSKIVTPKFFKKIKSPKITIKPNKPNPFKDLLKDPELIADAVDWSWKNKYQMWKDLGEKCLGCGICTYVCPICHCFSMEDRVSLDNSKCRRCRNWDACTLPKFSEVAGGHNFHRNLKFRYYNWFYHKFVRGYREYGRSQCVACGRCQDNCPAGINIEEILFEIVSDYKKAKKLK